jgi:hypothetical protein
MGRESRQQATPDLFGEPPPATNEVLPSPKRHVLPKDLPNAVKHLDDQEFDRLLAVTLSEAKRRGKALPRAATDDPVSKRSSGPDKSAHPRGQMDAATVSLTRGQVNAVLAAFKAGIKPSQIARQFRISQSDVRKVLASVPGSR